MNENEKNIILKKAAKDFKFQLFQFRHSVEFYYPPLANKFKDSKFEWDESKGIDNYMDLIAAAGEITFTTKGEFEELLEATQCAFERSKEKVKENIDKFKNIMNSESSTKGEAEKCLDDIKRFMSFAFMDVYSGFSYLKKVKTDNETDNEDQIEIKTYDENEIKIEKDKLL